MCFCLLLHLVVWLRNVQLSVRALTSSQNIVSAPSSIGDQEFKRCSSLPAQPETGGLFWRISVEVCVCGRVCVCRLDDDSYISRLAVTQGAFIVL